MKERSIRVAYADPPYVGKAKKHYGEHPDYAGEVDHAELIARLAADYPDGWALSCSSPSLRQLLPLCPEGVRVMAWVKPFCKWKLGVRPAHAWEPVLVWPSARKALPRQETIRDFISAPMTMRRGLVGVKPDAFCFWLFAVLNLRPGDRLDDLFPGSGAVADAWGRYQAQWRFLGDAPGAPEQLALGHAP